MLNEGEVLYPVVMNYKDLRFSVDGRKQIAKTQHNMCGIPLYANKHK
jgi:hypothetical protein